MPSAPPPSERAGGSVRVDTTDAADHSLAASPVEEWGDFSHHRPVSLISAEPTPAYREQLAVVAAGAARQYFERGYQTVGWKITEGTSYEDPTWHAAYQTAVGLGRRFVGYAFVRNGLSGAVQADYLLDRWEAGTGTGRLRSGLDIPCCDIEDTSSPARARAATLEFTRRAVARGYTYGLVYSGLWYAAPNSVRLDDLPVGWRNGWLSDYNGAHPDASYPLPAGWPRGWVVARQTTSTRPGLPGLPMGCDFNRTLGAWPSSGTEDDLPAAEIDKLLKAVATLQQDVDQIHAALRRVQDGVDLIYRGDDPEVVAKTGKQTHPENVRDLYAALTDPARSAVLKRVGELREQLQSGVDPGAVVDAIDRALSSAVDRIEVRVAPPAKSTEPASGGVGGEES